MIKHTLFVITCAVVAAFDRLCGRELAINAAEAPPADVDPALAVGLPGGISSTAVAARKAALVAAGTPPIYAEKFAIDAEQQQAWHDNPKLREQGQASPLTAAEREAAAITAAQKIDPSKVKAPTGKQLDERQALVDEAEKAAAQLAGMTVEQLRDYAGERNIALTADMKKSEIIAAIKEAGKA